jgi:hypothetical protein
VPNRYGPARENFEYTKSPGSDGADDIETINRKIMNQHPEDISLLADRWQNANQLLVSIRAQLLQQAKALEERWRKSDARALFLEKGPGKTLAYLDDWIEATQSNVAALRALVPIAESSRKRMSEIWADYKRDIAAARDISTWDEIQEDLQFWQGWRMRVNPVTGMFGVTRDTSEAKEEAAREAVNAVHERYTRLAQEHASKVAFQYGQTFANVGEGHGALFEPMNVVFNPPHPPLPAVPGAPGAPGVPGMPGAPGVPPGAPSVPPQLFAVAATLQPQQQFWVTGEVAVPPAPTPPVAPAISTPAVPAPPVPPGPLAPPVVSPPVLPVAPSVPAVPTARPSVNPGALPPGEAPTAPPNASRPGVRNGVLRASTAPATPPSLPPGMPQSPGTLGRKPSGPADEERAQRTQTVRPVNSEGEFASPPPPGSPVLGNPRQGSGRPGSGRPPSPGVPRRTDPAATGAPDGTVSPVLRAPSTGQPVPAPPAPARPRTPAPTAAPGSDWLGADAARGRAADPLLGRRKPQAASMSGMEEVPEGLRRRRAASSLTGPEHGGPGDVVELAPRRAVSETPALAEVPPDEEAFHVETPGGGVIGKQSEQATYSAEPPPLLGRG